jgi:ornithine cyclodeaminase/alanine dehydrogenase-like protein (mu-crystallin family)
MRTRQSERREEAAMISPILQLNADEVLSALDGIDPIETLVEELVGRRVGGPAWRPTACGRLTPWPSGTEAADVATAELVLLDDLIADAGCVLPTASLRAVRAAGLTALAARELLAPGVVTAAVLGSGPAVQPQLTVIARHVPDVSHIAICPTGDRNVSPVEPRVLDQIDLAGIGLSVNSAVDEAVFGANLVVATGTIPSRLELAHLTRGAVLVNATYRDLPDDLVDRVDRIYLDDAGLIDDHSDRYFVRAHLTVTDAGADRPRPAAGGHLRRHAPLDLGQVLTGAHSGRAHVDDILLVELLSADVVDVSLACKLHHAARERGLGAQLLT